MNGTAVALQDATFRQLRDLIYDRSGIFIPDTKKYFLENKLMRRLQEDNLDSFEDYLYLIRYGANGSELTRLFDIITTNETFFFREPQHFEVLLDYVMPEISRSAGVGGVRIWSAACSTGEEPYTISMMRSERKPDVRVELFASDISEGVLSSASRGIYTQYSIRNVPEPYLRKYFRQNGQAHELDLSVRRSVKFQNINLTDERKMKTMSGMDIIFCRNVLIYFDDKAKQKAVSLLYNNLRPGGFLFMGTTESLHNVTRAFKPVIVNKAIVYRRT